MSRSAVSLRLILSGLLTKHSAVRFRNCPTHGNTIHALVIVLLALPLTVFILLLLVMRRPFRKKLRVLVLAVDGEFGAFINFMEVLRGELSCDRKYDHILVLSPHRHATLTGIYCDSLKTPIVWGNGLSVLFQQALLLQPSTVASLEIRTMPYLHRASCADWNVVLPRGIDSLRTSLLKNLGLRPYGFVAMAVYTAAYERERNPRFVQATANLISSGVELVEGIDYLKTSGLDVVLLGSPDTGKSLIPRRFLRLADFGHLGGPEEVALASCCKYFWTDNVGAWWLTVPFGRPVLFSNSPHRVTPHPTVGRDMYVPRLYETLKGRRLSLREMLYREGSLYQSASRGELRMIRNSPEEIQEAHVEMLARVNGVWTGTAVGRNRQERVKQLNLAHPSQYHPMLVPEAFLARHEYLLD